MSSSANTNNNQPLFGSALDDGDGAKTTTTTTTMMATTTTGDGISRRWRLQWWRRDGRWDTLTMAHKNKSRGHKNECDGLTLGKIIFGYTPRVVLPHQQPVSNATMEQVKRWGEEFPTMGWMQFRHIKKVMRFFVRQHLPAKSRSVRFYDQSYPEKIPPRLQA